MATSAKEFFDKIGVKPKDTRASDLIKDISIPQSKLKPGITGGGGGGSSSSSTTPSTKPSPATQQVIQESRQEIQKELTQEREAVKERLAKAKSFQERQEIVKEFKEVKKPEAVGRVIQKKMPMPEEVQQQGEVKIYNKGTPTEYALTEEGVPYNPYTGRVISTAQVGAKRTFVQKIEAGEYGKVGSVVGGIGVGFVSAPLSLLSAVIRPKETVTGLVQVGKRILSGEGLPEVSQAINRNPQYFSGQVIGNVLFAKGSGVISQIIKALGYPKYKTVFLGKPVITEIDDVTAMRYVAQTQESNLFYNRNFISAGEVRAKPIADNLYKTAGMGVVREAKIVLGTNKVYYTPPKKVYSYAVIKTQPQEINVLTSKRPMVWESLGQGELFFGVGRTPSSKFITVGIQGETKGKGFVVARTQSYVKEARLRLLKYGQEEYVGVIDKAEPTESLVFGSNTKYETIKVMPTEKILKSQAVATIQENIKASKVVKTHTIPPIMKPSVVSTEVKQRPIATVKQTVIQAEKVNTNLKIKPSMALTDRQVQKETTRFNIKQEQNVLQSVRQTQNLLQNVRQEQRQQQKQVQILKLSQIAPKPISIPKPIPMPSSKVSISSFSQGQKDLLFSIQARRFGQWLEVGKAETKSKAFQIGLEKVRSNLGASFRVVGRKGIEKDFYLPTDITPSKRERGVFVQKSKFRLSRRPEVTEIQMFRKKKKSNSFRWF